MEYCHLKAEGYGGFRLNVINYRALYLHNLHLGVLSIFGVYLQ